MSLLAAKGATRQKEHGCLPEIEESMPATVSSLLDYSVIAMVTGILDVTWHGTHLC